MSEMVMTAMGDCIRCGRLFEFDPDTVPSSRVHPETLCPIRPDGTPVKSGDPDGMREPLCDPCASVFHAAGGHDRPLSELFPRARLDRIDVAAALRIQAAEAAAPLVWAATRRAGLDFHAFRSPQRTRCDRSTASTTSITLTEDEARSAGMRPCPRCHLAGGVS